MPRKQPEPKEDKAETDTDKAETDTDKAETDTDKAETDTDKAETTKKQKPKKKVKTHKSQEKDTKKEQEYLSPMEPLEPLSNIKMPHKRKVSISRSSAAKSENLAALSAALMHDAIGLLHAQIEAGASNLMQGYASTIELADMMFAAGLLSETAYLSVMGLSTIMTGVATFDAAGHAIRQFIPNIFGGDTQPSALAPTLVSKVVQTTNPTTGEKRTETYTAESGKSGDNASALAGALTPLIAAGAKAALVI